MRNWSATLFAASYKGAAFYIERDGSDGGRRLVVHEFPNRDLPYIEDLGSCARKYDVTAYLASDTADSDALTLASACDSANAGVLVLPDQGPLMAWCMSFQRQRERDRQGYIAFSLKFVREGADSSLTTIASLAQTIYDQFDSASAALAARLNSGLIIANAPSFVVTAAQAAVSGAIDNITVLRAMVAGDPIVSASTRDALAVLRASIPTALTALSQDTTVIPALIDQARQYAFTCAPLTLIPVLAQMIAANPAPPATVTATVNGAKVASNGAQAAQLIRGLALILWGEALAAATFPARPDAVSAKAAYAEMVTFDLDLCQGANDADYQVALMDSRGAVMDYMTRQITDLAPVISVRAAASMPAVWWAWRLYADPTRAGELVARNHVAAPALMPLSFEALAS